jgi:pimeloyl-ACP methyl ester carboxylesterase
VTLTSWPPWPTLDVARCADVTASGGDAVYVHGFGEDKHALAGFARRTLPAGYSGWLPTLRAHGEAKRPEFGYTPGDFAADLQRTFTGIGRHHVIGYSFGGIVASAYALAVGPTRVSGLVVIDQAYERRPDRYEPGEWAEVTYMKWLFDYRHHLTGAARLGIPVLLVYGRDSPVVTAEEKQFWAAADITGLTVETADGTHQDLVHGPCTAAALTAAFLGSLSAEWEQTV